MKRLAVLFAVLLVAGCGGTTTSTQTSQSQAAMLHSLLDSKTPRPTTPSADAAAEAADARFIEALKELPLTLPPQHQVTLGKQVCASLAQKPDSTIADLVSGIQTNAPGDVDPSQAQFIATTAVSIYCPDEWVRPVV